MRRKNPYPDWGVEMTSRYMKAHHQWIHGTDPDIDWDRLLVSQHKNLPQVYEVSFPNTTSKCHRPLPGRLWWFSTRSGLTNHFNRTQWRDSIQILEDHPTPYPHWKRCGRQVTSWILKNQHYTLVKYHIGRDRRRRKETVQWRFEAS